jgi:hypothetical protein
LSSLLIAAIRLIGRRLQLAAMSVAVAVVQAETAGLAAIVSGGRSLQPNDDALLRAVSPMLDSLYASYGQSAEQRR